LVATIRSDGKAVFIFDMSALIDVVTGTVWPQNVFRRTTPESRVVKVRHRPSGLMPSR
jgi:hypothetical protein